MRSANPSCNIPRRSLDYIGRTMEEVLLGKERVIFILQNLSFVMSKEKHCMAPRRVMELLAFIMRITDCDNLPPIKQKRE